jgi:aminoglycoside 3-N-acetyltransferase
MAGPELAAITAVTRPVTSASMTADLRRLGVPDGAVLLVHSSLSAIGWVAGHVQAVVAALLAAVGPAGTLVVPSHSGHLSEPSTWENPPVPASWWPVIRAEMPPFDPAVTPTREMGAIADAVRTWPGALRSAHPSTSFAAVGARAEEIVGGHDIACAMGERSPLARVFDLDGWVLLLGVGHDRNSSLHLGEHRASWPGKTTERLGAPVVRDGERVWFECDDLVLDTDDFTTVGDAFADAGHVTAGLVGAAPSMLMRQRPLVDYATTWFGVNRQ